jgi:predicted TIM-barrel fold metal-dependent hydrolase
VIVGLDIDGTAFTHEYPNIGRDIGAFPWLLSAQDAGARFIVFTMRDGQELKDAVAALREKGLRIFGCNVNPTQWQWTMSPKAYCHLYIDDNGLGMPLVWIEGCDRQAVDWDKAGPMLLEAIEEWFKRHADPLADRIRYTGGSHG